MGRKHTKRKIVPGARRWVEKHHGLCPVCGKLHPVHRWAGNKIRIVICPELREVSHGR